MPDTNLSYQESFGYGITTLFLAIAVFWFIRSCGARPNHVPGPLIARYSNLWRVTHMLHLARNRDDRAFWRKMQTQYGDYVRTGPSTVTVLDPEAIPLIYSIQARLDKGPAYLPFRPPGAKLSINTIRDVDTHSRYRRLVSNAFTPTSIAEYERHIEVTTQRLLTVCREHAGRNEALNLDKWIQLCEMNSHPARLLLILEVCHDTISKVTLGESFGFMDGAGQDKHSIIHTVSLFGRYVPVIAILPWLHHFLLGNPLLALAKPPPFVDAVQQRITKRLHDIQSEYAQNTDVLSHFRAMHLRDPLMDYSQLETNTVGVLMAGALTPSRSLIALLRHLAESPDCQSRLRAEIRGVTTNCEAFPSYDRLKTIPLLGALIQEAARLHGTLPFHLQRVVGAAGLALPHCPEWRLPPGTKLDCPPDNINQDRRVFGDDASSWRPERWLQVNEEEELAYRERRKLWDRTMMTFGLGSRACPGRGIFEMEAIKVVAAITYFFEFTYTGNTDKGESLIRLSVRSPSSRDFVGERV